MKQFLMWCADKPGRAYTLGAIHGFFFGAVFVLLFLGLTEAL